MDKSSSVETGSSNVLGKLNENKWSIFALGAIAGGLMMSRGGMAALMPLLRLLAPVLILLFVINIIKKKLMAGGIGQGLKAKMEDAMRQAQQQGGKPSGGGGKTPGSGKVIDLCPKCGSYLAAGHRCKKA